MGFTKSTDDLKIHQKLSDEPNIDDGLSAEELKLKFDKPVTDLQKSFNKLIDELENAQASKYIGAEPLDEYDDTENNIQAKLLKIRAEIQNTTLGKIPDGTIAEEKMNVEYNNLLAKRNSELQTNLNSEMVNGQTIEHINDLINKYNVPTVSKMYDTYNYLSLDNKIKDYYENMRVLIDLTENTTEYFSSSIIPILESPSTPVNGFYYTHGDKTEYNVNTNLIFDKNDSTSGKVSKSGISLYFPIGIKNFNIKFYSEYNEDTSSEPKHGYYILKLYGRLKSSDSFILLKTENYSETKEINLLIDDDKIYDAIELVFSNETAPGLTVVARTIYTIDITTGYQERFKNGLQSYININNLGNKLIKDAIEEGKKYELVYDGTMFSAREVV